MLGRSQRQAMLKAMGYRPLRLRGTPDLEPIAAPQPASVPVEQATAPLPRDPAIAPRPQPAPRASQPTDRDPLWQALLRAVHASLDQVDALGWEAVLDGPPYRYDGPRLYLNLISLRGNAQAKRALWKTLRALRRRRAGSQP